MSDKLAVIQSTETVAELEAINKKLVTTIDYFHDLVEIGGKINSGLLKGTPKEFLASEKEMINLQNQKAKILKELSSAENLLAAAELKRSKINIEEAKAIKEDANAQNAAIRLKKQQISLTAQEEKTLKQLNSAYDELNRKHIEARKHAQDMGVQHGILSKEFLNAAKISNQYDQELKRIDVSLGKFNRNVGNYHGNMFGLNAQMAQVMREMPNFAIDPRIGIMSLTNNLPYLADAIADVSRESKVLKVEYLASAAAAREKAIADAIATGATEKHALALGKQAEAQMMANYQSVKAPSVMKQIIGSLFSWQSLLIVGISLLMMYNKEIIAWTKSLFAGSDAAKAAAQNTKDLNDIRKESIKTATAEISKLEILYRVATNEALSREQRLRATDQLQKIYPSYFKNMTDEQIMLGKGINKYLQLRDAILASARARAAEKILGEKQEKLLEGQSDATSDIADNMQRINKLTAFLKSGKKFATIDLGIVSQDYNPETAKKAIANLKKQNKEILKGVSKESKEFQKQNNFIIKQIAKDQQTAAPYEADVYGANAPKEKSPKVTKEKVKKEKDNTKELERELKKQYDIEKDNIDNLYKVRLEAIKNNIELAKEDPYSSETEKLNNQINFYSELIKVNAEYYDALIANAKKYNQSTTDLEKARDIASGNFETSRNALALKTPEALKKDLEYQQKIDDYSKSAGNEERKRLIINNIKLSQKEKEYQLSVLDQEIRIESLNTELQRIEARKTELQQKATLGQLTRDEKTEWAQISADAEKTANAIEDATKNLQNTKIDKFWNDIQPVISVLKSGFDDLGLGGVADQFDSLFANIKKDLEDGKLDFKNWKDYVSTAMNMISSLSASLTEQQRERRIAELNEELEATRIKTDQELEFIDKRLNMLNALENATKEQIEERNALEDEARTIKEQQMQREKMIEAKKARAIQRAAAQQAIINGFLAASTTLATLGIPAGIIPAAIAAGFGAVQAGLIMSKDPVPRYFVGRKGGKEEIAWTQEKGREIITDKDGNVKSLGSDKGATLTKLAKGDNVYTAEETQKILSDLGGVTLDSNIFHKIARQGINPVFVQGKEIDYDKLGDKVGERFERIFKKYDKVTTFEDEDGNVFQQEGGKIPVWKYKKRQPKIDVKIKGNGRD